MLRFVGSPPPVYDNLFNGHRHTNLCEGNMLGLVFCSWANYCCPGLNDWSSVLPFALGRSVLCTLWYEPPLLVLLLPCGHKTYVGIYKISFLSASKYGRGGVTYLCLCQDTEFRCPPPPSGDPYCTSSSRSSRSMGLLC